MPAISGLDARRLVAAELAVLEVDVVDDLGDRLERRIARPARAEQHLEGAAVALVRELGLEHVEAELAGLRHVALGRHELEPGLRVDEPADQPGRGDAVDVHALRASPRSGRDFSSSAGTGFLGWFSVAAASASAALEPGEQPLDGLAAVGAEEVDRDDLGEPRP